MGQVGYYAVIIALGVGNLVLAMVAYVQRRTQIRGNALREHQVSLAVMRNELAEQRLSCLEHQVALLTDIRAALLGDGPARPGAAQHRSLNGQLSPAGRTLAE
jgi:hypothetical protein